MSETPFSSLLDSSLFNIEIPNYGSLTDVISKDIAPQIFNVQSKINIVIKEVVEKNSMLENQLQVYKSKLIEAQAVIRKYEQQYTSVPRFAYIYDCTDFGDNTDPELMADNLYELVQIKTPEDEYLINNQAALTPVFIMMTKSVDMRNNNWIYCGTIGHFVLFWNQNIAARIEDKQRREELTCNSDSLKADINKSPWKNSSPGSWKRMLLEGTKQKKLLNRAVNIKARIEQIFNLRTVKSHLK